MEKKRERNRIAASKCRQRKLEKIQVLEEQVFNLKKENEQLRRSYERLRESLEKSNAQIDFHRRNGCSIDNSTSREVRKTKRFLIVARDQKTAFLLLTRRVRSKRVIEKLTFTVFIALLQPNSQCAVCI